MGFKAEEAVEPLDWDFNPYVEAKGTIPEPSDRQVSKFLRRYQRTVQDVVRLSQQQLADAQNLTDEERAARRAELPQTVAECVTAMQALEADEDTQRLADLMIEMTAEVCSGSPGEDVLRQVPFRVRGMFFGWLVGELSNPEGAAADSKPSLRAV